MSEKIPKAEDLIRGLGQFNEGQITVLSTLIIEHTKDHVKAALQSASKKAEIMIKDVYSESYSLVKSETVRYNSMGVSTVYPDECGRHTIEIQKESILNSYNSENIK